MSLWTRVKEAIGGPRILYEETLEEAARARSAAAFAPKPAAAPRPAVAETFAIDKDGGITLVVEPVKSFDDTDAAQTLDEARREVASDLNALAGRLAKAGVRLRAVDPEPRG